MGEHVKVWDNVNMLFMPPSVNVKKEDAENLADWILNLDTQGIQKRPTPPKQP
jgi:cytochrome c551/c552